MTVPLRRNRDFMLLQTGQLLSSAGTQVTSIAYPLLVLSLTGSASKAGFVAFARLLPMVLFALPAGLAADRWSRKALMIGADCVRVLAVGALATALLADSAVFWMIPVVAFVEGAGHAVFTAARDGAMRSVVPAEQLPAAVAAQTGRQATVNLAGAPLGGALFGIARSLPFIADVVSYAFSTCSLLAMKARFQEERDADRASIRERLTEGFRFLWGQPFLRACAFLFGLGNFIGPGLLFTVVVLGTHQGLSSGAVGILVAAFSACVLLGSFLSPFVRRALPVRAVLVLEFWTWSGCAIYLIWPNVYVLLAGMLPTALVIPSTDSIVHAFGIALTPDRLLGRAGAVRMTIALAIAPLGPLVAGALLGAASGRATVAVFAAFALALAIWGTLSPSIRAAPALKLAEPPPAEDGGVVRV
jgi:predicted MFS family arabinose efflux permease